MNKKQWCLLAAATAMLLLTALGVWKLQQVPANGTDGSVGTTAIFTSSIVMYVAYLFSILPGRSKNCK